ncbi:polysaccharide biosynthesis tyrosine autokinase [Rubripirellula lacrimiformis]|nr:polysaccharide biosynthesis tyrosine autokinase [Rubripirellula lacrimiformis]
MSGPSDVSVGGVLWRRKGVILLLILCGLGAGYWFFTTQDETFRAAATIEVYSQNVPTNTGSASEIVVETAPNLAFIQAEMTSQDVLSDAIAIGQLTAFDETPADVSSLINMIRANLVLSPPFEGAESPDRTIVEVSFESGDPTVATAIVNAVVDAYDKSINGRHQGNIENVVGFFRDSRDSIIPKLDELENEFTEFRANAPLEWNGKGEAINPYRDDAIRLEDNLYNLQSQARQLDSKLRLIREAVKGGRHPYAVFQEVQYLLDDVRDIEQMHQAIVEAPNDNLELQTQLMDLRVQAEMLAIQFAANHPQRLTVEQKLKATEKALRELQQTRNNVSPEKIDVVKRQDEAAQALLTTYVSSLRKKQDLINEDVADTTKRLEDVRAKALKLMEFEGENASFLRRIARYQETLDLYDTQLEKANLPGMNSGLHVKVLRPAGLGMLVGPLLSRALVMGGFLGLVAGGALAFLWDWSERTFRSPDEISTLLGLPILAHLPVILTPSKRQLKKSSGNDLFPHTDQIVTVLHHPHAPCSEAVRSVRTSLFPVAGAPPEYQVLQITSALPGDGKSTVAANLAASVARAGKRVLLIDADLRRPTQAKIFGVQSELGLTSLINGEGQLADIVVPTDTEDLFVLASGPRPNNPAEALMMPEFGQILDEARLQFDLIIIDTPPLLAVTDASNVATYADGVMVVMRIGRNIKPMSKRAITMLRMLHVNIIGLVINAVGDSGYSATYSQAWSDSYGGQPGGEYGHSYYRYGSDRYLDASKGQTITVRSQRSRNADPARAATLSEPVKTTE